MFSLRRLVALALLAVWLPATLHCDIETAGLAGVFACCDDERSPAAANDHCDDDACKTVEDGAVKTDALAKLVHPAALIVIALLPPAAEIPACAVRPASTDAPPELGRSWQFSVRAAPPARAPDVLG